MSRGLLVPARTLLLLLAVASVRPGAHGGQYWVSPTGNDANPGTFGAPFATIAKAMSLSSTVFRPGDTVFVRGGTYVTTTPISISKRGVDSARYHLLVLPGERAVLDCSGMTVSGSNRGISLSGSYWLIRGIDIKGAGDNGMHVTGSNNTIEFCSFFENRDTGLQLSGGASFNAVINCDAYANADPGQGNADGFAPKLDVGTGNYFYGCRSWQNSDDGWDGYLRPANDVTTTLENCWCFAERIPQRWNSERWQWERFQAGRERCQGPDAQFHPEKVPLLRQPGQRVRSEQQPRLDDALELQRLP